MSSDEFKRRKCPFCGDQIIVRFDGKLAPHNLSWNPPVDGVAYPNRCAGSLVELTAEKPS